MGFPAILEVTLLRPLPPEVAIPFLEFSPYGKTCFVLIFAATTNFFLSYHSVASVHVECLPAPGFHRLMVAVLAASASPGGDNAGCATPAWRLAAGSEGNAGFLGV